MQPSSYSYQPPALQRAFTPTSSLYPPHSQNMRSLQRQQPSWRKEAYKSKVMGTEGNTSHAIRPSIHFGSESQGQLRSPRAQRADERQLLGKALPLVLPALSFTCNVWSLTTWRWKERSAPADLK